MNNHISVLFLVFLAVTLLYLAGVVFFLTDHEPGDKCEMTYMFEYPQYVRISQEIDKKYSKYGLYAYGEGRITKRARNMYFDGIPVLFIPGNAGSHQQVRSLSSIALRKALNSGTPYHFDYFTIDLNSEFSALYGPILFDQLDYVLHSIDRILGLYKNSPSSPERVVLIGHSVGGIVAKKAIATLLEQRKYLVSILVLLATPLQREPVYFDRYGSNFFASSSYDRDNIVTVSIAGGYSDILVPAYLTSNEGNSSINLVATNIAKSWVETNHVQILWCKQLVLAINRALFDSVDHETHQISPNSTFVKQIFKHHLIHNSGTKLHIFQDTSKPTKIDYRGEWVESLYRQYTVDLKRGLKQPHWYMVGLSNLPSYEKLTVLAVNLEVTDWVFVCNAAFPNKGSRVCVEGQHLTHYSEIAPSSRFKRRLLTVNMHEIRRRSKEYTHVVFRALPTNEQVTFHVDVYGSHEREALIYLPLFSMKKRVVVRETPEKALIFNLVLPELEDPLQIYQLFVDPLKCNSNQHHATASLIVPWANESVHTHFTESLNKPFIVRVQNGKPQGAESAKIRLILEPSCTYKLSIRLHLLGVFGQIARYYSTFLLNILTVIYLLAFQNQVHKLSQTGKVPIFFSSLFDGLKQAWILIAIFLVSIALKSYLPQPEYRLFPNSIYLGLALTVIFMVSYIFVFILVAAYCLSLFTLESTVHKLTLKLLARTVTLTVRFSDYFMTFLQKVPFLVALGMIVLCWSTCGGLALCVGLVFYFLKLTQMSQEYVEQVAWYIVKNLARKIKLFFCKPKNEEGGPDRQPLAVKDKETVTSIENVTDQSITEGTATLSEEEAAKNDETSDEIEAKEIIEIERVTEDTKENEAEKNSLAERESTQESADVEPNDRSPLKDLTETNNAIFFHSSIFFMWVIVTILNVPATLTWAHNYKYSRRLSPDESLIPGLVFSLGGFFLWQFELPRTDRKFMGLLHLVILCLIPPCFLYATVSVYRLNYTLTFLFALLLLQQIFAPKLETFEDVPLEPYDRKEHDDKYDEIKKKMD